MRLKGKNNKKKPLWRKVNTKAAYVHHHFGADYANMRHAKDRTNESKMVRLAKRGLDYTPLVRFLHSKAGKPWVPVLKEAVSRLDQTEPIKWIVKDNNSGDGYTRCGESSYYSTMYVDDKGLLQFVRPTLHAGNIRVIKCKCCTFTFNGKVF